MNENERRERNHNLESIAPVLATFKIKQTIMGVDDLKDDNLGEPVMLTGNSEISKLDLHGTLLGKLISLTLTDNDDGERYAIIQIRGCCRFATSEPYPNVGERVIGGGNGTVIRALPTHHYGRGTVLDVWDKKDCIILL